MLELIQPNTKPELKKEEIFVAVVNPGFGSVTKDKNGLVIYPSETELRKDRLGKPGMIWLDELINKNCKVCYGTGRIGFRPVEKHQRKAVAGFLLENIDKQSNQELIGFFTERYQVKMTDAIINTIREAPLISRGKLVMVLVNEHIADAIRRTQPVYCNKCLLPNYRAKVNELTRLLQFK